VRRRNEHGPKWLGRTRLPGGDVEPLKKEDTWVHVKKGRVMTKQCYLKTCTYRQEKTGASFEHKDCLKQNNYGRAKCLKVNV